MQLDTNVLIIGAGPAGTALALCLARQGIGSMIIERRSSRSDHPRAHYLNTRTIELFQLWGAADEVIAGSFPYINMMFEQLAGMGGPTMEDRARFSSATNHSTAQDIVEEALERVLSNYNETQIKWGTSFAGLIDHGDHVEIQAETDGKLETIRARWCVAADGATSNVRNCLGVNMIGDPHLGSVINIYFRGKLNPEGVSYMLGALSIHDTIKGAFISMDGAERWCFHYNYDPEKESVEDFTFDRCTKMVRSAMLLPDDWPIEVKSIRPWVMTAHVAESFRVGSTFLIGDAAHAFPPTGGFGLNSGVQDAHNLAWKFKAVLDGIAGEKLLDSYEAERQPIAFLNTAQSFRNNHTMNLQGLAGLPTAPLETIAEIERRATKSVQSIADKLPAGGERDAIEMLEHGAALGQELGFIYDESSVIVSDGVPLPATKIASYIPSASPGARAPYFVVRKNGKDASSVHLLDGYFTLLTISGGHAWRDAATRIPSQFQLRNVCIGNNWDADPAAFANLYGISPEGAVLVRPDGHVAFRSHSGPVSENSLQIALNTSLGYY
jgi:2-polyprenyl-6-methoxyphenol hydroxylase-like FAD-dependent oxidoreductase